MNCERIQKVENKYIAEDCVQVMVPYKKSLSIYEEGGESLFIEFHYYDPLFEQTYSGYLNRYYNDSRRFLFPYSNIETHNSIKRFTKLKYVNVILDFDKIYKLNIDKQEIYAKVLRYGSDALVYMSTERYAVENIIVENLQDKKVSKTAEPHISKLLNKKLRKFNLKEEKEVDYIKALQKKQNEEIEQLKRKYDSMINEEEMENPKILKKYL